MEEPAVQHEKIDKSQEQGEDGGKADWKHECSFSDLLKHSCFLCWSSPGDTDVIEMDDGVLAKAGEIRVRPQHLPLVCAPVCVFSVSRLFVHLCDFLFLHDLFQ
ncbi:hypothetical protein ILYODFUR_038799 [Ilyodon furcidens]|uniref:Uncharacterized protein n=1 Tax=Ilyodon furcidens TaxID=33524 RepID=A0ABV0UBX9_9TELE